MTRSLVNLAVGTQETVIPEGVDAIAKNVIAFARSAATCNKHPAWPDCVPLCGRCLDLEAAYKQCPVNPEHLPFVVIALDEPTSTGSSTAGMMRLFLSDALPFGSTASVLQFNRLSAALKSILTKLLGLTVSFFYDDYVQVEPAVSSSSAHFLIESACDILGIQFSRKHAKRHAFAAEFTALGVKFELRPDRVAIMNTDGRKYEVKLQVQAMIRRGTITPKEAASLRGRVQFLESQLWARA
eukprot:6105257-Amphidinium_carterae.1